MVAFTFYGDRQELRPSGWTEHYWTQKRQCFFRSSQRETFVETQHQFSSVKREGGRDGFPWNEINFFSEGGLQSVLMRNLVGIFDFRGDGSRFKAAADGLARLGRSVPRFSLRGADQGNQLWMWDPTRPVELRGYPYLLTEHHD